MNIPELRLVLERDARFPLGRIVMTEAAHVTLDHETVHDAIARHARGDWGLRCDEDREQNERSLREGSQLTSAYHDGWDWFYIITEADRASTCVLLADE